MHFVLDYNEKKTHLSLAIRHVDYIVPYIDLKALSNYLIFDTQYSQNTEHSITKSSYQ